MIYLHDRAAARESSGVENVLNNVHKERRRRQRGGQRGSKSVAAKQEVESGVDTLQAATRTDSHRPSWCTSNGNVGKTSSKSAKSNIPTVLLKTLQRFNANKQAARIISPWEPAAPERREKKEKKKSSKVCGASPEDCARRSIIDALEVSFPAGCGHSERRRRFQPTLDQNTAVLRRRRQVDGWKTHCNTGGRVPPRHRSQEEHRPGVRTRKRTLNASPLSGC